MIFVIYAYYPVSPVPSLFCWPDDGDDDDDDDDDDKPDDDDNDDVQVGLLEPGAGPAGDGGQQLHLRPVHCERRQPHTRHLRHQHRQTQ